jgi:hypothetical protein
MSSTRGLRRGGGMLAAVVAALAALLATTATAGAAPPPPGGVTGYAIVQGNSTNITPGENVAASAQCPAGKVVLSGGVSAHSPLTFINSSYPTDSRTWEVVMTDTGVETYTEHFTPYAVCVDASSVPGIVQVSSGELPVGPNTYYGANIAAGDEYCASGQVVVGGGVNSEDPSTLLTISQPTSDERAWQVFVHLTHPPLSGTSYYDTYSVCVPGADFTAYQIGTGTDGQYGSILALGFPGAQATAVPPGVTNTAGSPYCPAGEVAVAGGAANHDTVNGFISSVYPNSSGEYWLATDTETDPPSGYQQWFVPNDICVSEILPTTLVAYPQLSVFGGPTVGFGAVGATLTSGGNPVVGRTISFSLGTLPLCSAPTNANGFARCTLTFGQENAVLFANRYSASFAGDSYFLPSNASTVAIKSPLPI